MDKPERPTDDDTDNTGRTAMELTAATIAARAACNQLAELPPFSLTPKIGTRTTVQGDLF